MMMMMMIDMVVLIVKQEYAWTYWRALPHNFLIALAAFTIVLVLHLEDVFSCSDQWYVLTSIRELDE